MVIMKNNKKVSLVLGHNYWDKLGGKTEKDHNQVPIPVCAVISYYFSLLPLLILLLSHVNILVQDV